MTSPHVDRDPDCAGGDRADRPVLRVLVPGRGLAVTGGFGEKTRVPQQSRRNKFNMEPSEAENQMLARLLSDHDEQVTAFKLASETLRNSNREAFDALWVYINEINVALVPFESKGVH